MARMWWPRSWKEWVALSITIVVIPYLTFPLLRVLGTASVHIISGFFAPSSYPEEISSQIGWQTDESSTQAFRDHDLIIPRDVAGLRYAATNDPRGAAMFAYFRLPCGEASGFAAENKVTAINPASFDGVDSVVDVESDAASIRLKVNGPAAHWYQRYVGGDHGDLDVSVLVTGTGTACTVYVDSEGNCIYSQATDVGPTCGTPPVRLPGS